MKKELFLVKKPGLYTSIQDLGRIGYQHLGVPVSGVMDSYSFQIGNILVGNGLNEAGLEITMVGPELEVLSPHLIAITGANLAPKRNGVPIEMWKSFFVEKGDLLTFSKPIHGMRSYLTVSGGISASIFFGSKSTYEKAKFGKKVENGEFIYSSNGPKKRWISGIMKEYVPRYEKEMAVRVILGQDFEELTKQSRENFLSTPYMIEQADRMGYRLTSSDPLIHLESADIISDAVPFGGIQVPANGQPIILMADRQTTGGYRLIATVISVDIPKLAQLPPGGTIRFKKVSINEAQLLYQKQYGLLNRWRLLMKNRC